MKSPLKLALVMVTGGALGLANQLVFASFVGLVLGSI